MNEGTLLLRNLHPSFVQSGRVTSQAFKPTPKDQKKLSVYDGDRIDPVACWGHFVKALGFKSVGILGVTVAECGELELAVRHDPDPFPEHMLIDFSDLSSSQVESKSKKLKLFAVQRGWLYETESPD